MRSKKGARPGLPGIMPASLTLGMYRLRGSPSMCRLFGLGRQLDYWHMYLLMLAHPRKNSYLSVSNICGESGYDAPSK